MIYYTQGIRSSVQYVAQRMRVLGIVLAGAILVRVALVVLFPMQFVNQLDAIPNYYLSTNTTAAGLAAGTLFTAVGPNGFSVGSSSLVNANTNNYVAWAWASSATSGFEMVKYTGNGANRTIAHSLGDTPDFMIVKRTDSTSDWIMYHQGLSSPSTQYLKLNSQSSLVTTDATIWNSTTPTSVNYSLGTNVAVNANAGSYIAYLWAEKAGYSKFGSYTGNGAADGAFVYTGFKPRYIFLGPASGATSQWLVYDTTRQTYNPNGRILSPDFSDAEGDLSIRYIDVLSNGFKIRTSASGVNPSGGIVIYAAFAEYPFKEQHMPNGYSIASSTRFSGSDARLSKTYSTTSSDGKKATLSLWFKPGKFTAYERIWSSPGGYETNWVEPTTGRLFFRFANYDFLTAGSIFRDVSAWIHLTLVFDSTQAVSTDRVKLYIDGVLNNYWATYSTIPLNTSMTLWMQNGGFNRIGCNTADGQQCYTGYLADIHSIDGQALAASDFGQFDSNGIWHPIAYAGSYIASSAQYLTSILSNGFQLGAAAISNTLSDAYVAWNWKESATAGFDIVSYTGNGANRIIAHSLSDTPDFMIIKRTDSTSDWTVWHQNLTTPTTQYLVMNSTASVATDATMWNSTIPTSANFSLGTNAAVNTNTGTYIAYLWAEKAGYSKFGSYTGNGAANGAFVYTDFKPKYIMTKSSSGATDWFVYDGARDTYNVVAKQILPNTTATDTTGTYIDILSNGFKFRTASAPNSAVTYVYAAFAENPFKEQHMPNGYSIASSTRFNGTNAYLNKTFAAAPTDSTKATVSFWFKRTKLAQSYSGIIGTNNAGADQEAIWFDANDKIYMLINNQDFNTTPVYRDPSNWNHFVLTYDSAQAVATDRVKLHINGVQVTNWDTYATIAQNTLLPNLMRNGSLLHIGRLYNAFYNHGYLADFYMIDGQALTPPSFGETDSTTGTWKPKAYSGTYGTNGFHLDFGNSADLGNDVSGNNNDWTANNIDATDWVKDSPTNNFAVFNRIDTHPSHTLSQGGLSWASNSQGDSSTFGSIGVSSGKWYWEYKNTYAVVNSNCYFGVARSEFRFTGAGWSSPLFYGYVLNGQKVNNGSFTAYGSAIAQNDVIGVALDLDNGTLTFYLNGSSQGQAFSGLTGTFKPAINVNVAEPYTALVNFGQGGQSGLTYNSASGGYFKYTPPTGFKALSTANLPATTAALVKGKNWFDAVAYTGTGATQSITSLNFQPDLVWIKSRSAALSHAIFDAVRYALDGTYCYLSSDTTSAKTCGNSNSFHLDFSDPADPGKDVSGLGNHWTNNNIATTDNVIDTPTNNFAVANSVNNFGTTLSQGNLLVTAGTGNLVRGSLGVSTGKYYWEGTATAITGTYWTMGLCDERNSVHTLPYDLRTTGCYGNMQAYYKTINGGALTAFDANGYDGATHTHMIAVDLDNDKIWFGLDGVWYDAGNPATNSNGYTISASQDGRTFMPVFGSGSASTLNFGQGGQSGLTYDAASGGYFKYTPPTGFKALSTANMPATSASLIKGKNWFDAVTYTGNGTAQSITSLNFEPGFVWVKNRTSATDHALFGDGTTGTTTVTIPFFMEW